MENISNQGKLTIASQLLPLEEQIANKVLKSIQVLVLNDPEDGSKIPLVWDGMRYKNDRDGDRICSEVKRVITEVFSEAVQLRDTSPNTEIKKIIFGDIVIQVEHVREYEVLVGFKERLTKHVLTCILSNPDICHQESDFDNCCYHINTPNGLLNLKTLELLPHSPDQLVRCVTKGNYLGKNSPDELPSDILKIIKEGIYDKKLTTDENERAVQSFFDIEGYFLIGGNREKILPVWVGPTNTGKSTYFNIRKYVLGDDYAVTISAQDLMRTSRSSSDIRPGVLKTRLARVVTAVETQEMATFDTAFLKTISGNDEQSFRRPYHDIIYFMPRAKYCLATNYFPKFVNAKDEAFIRRLLVVEFKNVPTNVDNGIMARMESQNNADMIFTYLARRANEYLQRNALLLASAFVASKERLILSQSDSVKLFWDERVTPDSYSTAFYPIALVYSAEFVPFCKSKGIDSPSMKVFCTRFKEIAEATPGVVRHDLQQAFMYSGIKIRLTNEGLFSQYWMQKWFIKSAYNSFSNNHPPTEH